MKNIILKEHVRTRVDARIERILRELGNPPPPVNLADVRELLKLSLSYFSGEDDDLWQRTFHRLRIARKQILERPMLLFDAIKQFRLRAIYLPDRRRVLLDDNVPLPKHRWLEAHEFSHDILPWHRALLFGDDEVTVTPACHVRIEAEANFAAGQLLFLRDRFVEEVRSSPITFAAVKTISGIYKNTLTTTLWRVIERATGEVPFFGVVSGHPHTSRRPTDFDPTRPCKHFVQSPSFAERFSCVGETDVFYGIARHCGMQRGGPLGAGELLLADDNGDEHVFTFETFYNGHEALTLGRHARKVAVAVSV